MMLKDLPPAVVDLISAGLIAEFVTVSAAGAPIDTPVLYFPSEGLQSIDLATGLAYPAKAERARRNPKVGLLIEGGPEEPVISVAGFAAVRDSNLQANAERYVAEAGVSGNPAWSLAREAVWYWTRIIIEVTPARILWWDRPSAMDRPPQRWSAPADTIYPQSDPAPPGKPSAPSEWRQPAWQDLAKQALAKGTAGHLSVLDSDGFPAPMRARSIRVNDAGFTIELPQGVPWSPSGKASLTFQGTETFVGDVTANAGLVSLRVERALPTLPLAKDTRELWSPEPATRENLMRRLQLETQRRGQPIPTMPAERPLHTEGYGRRMARIQAITPR